MFILDRILQKQGFILADGATGTNYFQLGLETGYPPELWSLEKPEHVYSRVERAKRFFSALSEETVAVVTHSDWIRNFIGGSYHDFGLTEYAKHIDSVSSDDTETSDIATNTTTMNAYYRQI